MKNKALFLQITLSAMIVSLCGATIVGFYFTQKSLLKYSNSSAAYTTEVSQSDIQTLQQKMPKLQETIGKIPGLIINRDEYKNQATQDINQYASESGVTISGSYNFPESNIKQNSLKFLSGQSTTNIVTFNIESPVEFDKFIKFISLIETNAPIMQISDINISAVQTDRSKITSGPITIEVYTK